MRLLNSVLRLVDLASRPAGKGSYVILGEMGSDQNPLGGKPRYLVTQLNSIASRYQSNKNYIVTYPQIQTMSSAQTIQLHARILNSAQTKSKDQSLNTVMRADPYQCPQNNPRRLVCSKGSRCMNRLKGDAHGAPRFYSQRSSNPQINRLTPSHCTSRAGLGGRNAHRVGTCGSLLINA